MSLRPAVLDDGLGGKVVGWQEGDLAAMELEPWEPYRPAAQRAVASRVAITMLPTPIPGAPAAVAAPVAVPVAPEPIVDEDEWEWEIALARARVAADEVQATVAAVTPRRTKPTPPPIPAPAVVPAAPKTMPMPVVTLAPEPLSSGQWPKTEPLGNIDYEDYTSPLTEVARAPIQPQPTPAPVAKPARPGTSPVTVIPVPRLPSLRDGGSITPMPRRYPKGTTPISDQTKPGIALPRAATTATLPSIKQRAASHS
ncbi:MAG TPA: hypothetical protein VIU61_10825 [Kofleriaceae bacterium]